jgi:hypothetical protein
LGQEEILTGLATLICDIFHRIDTGDDRRRFSTGLATLICDIFHRSETGDDMRRFSTGLATLICDIFHRIDTGDDRRISLEEFTAPNMKATLEKVGIFFKKQRY